MSTSSSTGASSQHTNEDFDDDEILDEDKTLHYTLNVITTAMATSPKPRSLPAITPLSSKPAPPVLNVSYQPDEDDHLDDQSTSAHNKQSSDDENPPKYPVVGELEWGLTSKGKPLAIMCGFSYIKQSTNKAETIDTYRCLTHAPATPCLARLYISMQGMDLMEWNQEEHSHVPHPIAVLYRKLYEKLKQRVLKEFIPVTRIVEYEYSHCGYKKEDLAQMPTIATTTNTMQKIRRNTMPALPKTQQFDFPAILTTTFEGQEFLVHDVCHDDFGGRLCIFADPSSLDILFESHTIGSDGTFKSCPPQFEQFYVIMGFELDRAIPLVYCLLSGRSELVYNEIWRCLKQLAIARGKIFSPKTLISDFEFSLFNSVATELPNTTSRGCLFHHGQACYRKIQEVGLMNDYNDGGDIRQFLRQFLALPLLPLHFVRPVFDELKKQAKQQQFYDDRLKEFILYFEDEWMQRWGPVAWCVGFNTHRTNNCVESENHRINQLCEIHHLNMWRFVNVIRLEQHVTMMKYEEERNGKINLRATSTTHRRKRDNKISQIKRLHAMLDNKQRKPMAVIVNLSYLVGNPIVKKKKRRFGHAAPHGVSTRRQQKRPTRKTTKKTTATTATNVATTATPTTTTAVTTQKRRGRLPGSKNKPKVDVNGHVVARSRAKSTTTTNKTAGTTAAVTNVAPAPKSSRLKSTVRTNRVSRKV